MDSAGSGLLRILAWTVAFGILAYVAVLALIYTQQRRLLFPASGLRVPAAQAGLPDVQDVVIVTRDGERLVGWWKPPEPGRALVLYFHGNGGSLLNRRDRVRLLTQDGRGILIVSYRGYSGSTGAPSEEGLREDARAARDWLSSYAPQRIVLYGESLGTGVAVRLATEREVGGVILDAPYTSTADIARGMFWYLPVALLMRDQFRSIDRIGDIKVPLLVMHGEADAVIPIALSELLHAAANEPKRYLRLPGVGHETILESGGIDAVRSFLAEIEAKLPVEAKAGPGPAIGRD
ncbi:alpha/beta hydrolase [Enterovirga aerilata]|uniref:alpha/beta hydrolase n=1 Tax=Enterovirga aerilata TaxID=2730920 RepID=UPI00158357FA|nr:alpha/beta hydrolase [Enterovirga sp. DB1703]